MKDIKSYLRKPYYLRNTKIDWSDFISLIFKYFLFTIILLIGIGILALIFKFENIVNKLNVKAMFIQAVLFAPLIEESFFRLLLKPKLRNLISFSIIMLPILSYLLWKENYILFTAVIIVELPILLIIAKRKNHLFKLQRKFIKSFPYFFYFSILIFGFIHISNITFTERNFWIILFSPILVSPQILMGSILGVIRMKYGFIYSVLFHTSINGIITLFLVIKTLF